MPKRYSYEERSYLPCKGILTLMFDLEKTLEINISRELALVFYPILQSMRVDFVQV